MKKLRNKITGEINEFMIHKRIEDSEDGNPVYAPFDGNIDEWEDYKDRPYVIDMWEDDCICDAKFGVELEGIERAKECGLYFDTKEEAEKAVEKLKAWHKLMDYWGTEVLGWEIRDMPTGGNWQTVNVKFNVKTKKEPMELLDIVFGGEE